LGPVGEKRLAHRELQDVSNRVTTQDVEAAEVQRSKLDKRTGTTGRRYAWIEFYGAADARYTLLVDYYGALSTVASMFFCSIHRR
jgi:hypothetical protein